MSLRAMSEDIYIRQYRNLFELTTKLKVQSCYIFKNTSHLSDDHKILSANLFLIINTITRLCICCDWIYTNNSFCGSSNIRDYLINAPYFMVMYEIAGGAFSERRFEGILVFHKIVFNFHHVVWTFLLGSTILGMSRRLERRYVSHNQWSKHYDEII